MQSEIDNIVKKLGLQKLWDKDFIKEDYCSDIVMQFDEGKRSRPLFNWAYYMILHGGIFPLHKLLSDESWQYCLGGAIDLFILKNGDIETVRVGPDIFNDEKLFYVVEKNTWFAAAPVPNCKYSLVTHCVSPGWSAADDIGGFHEDMIKLAPKHPDFIKKYSWPDSRKIYTEHDYYK